VTQRELTFTKQEAERLSGQLAAVRSVVGRYWLTLEQIRYILETDYGIHASTQSISARLRDLRKPRYGSYVVEKRRVSPGLWQYRVKA
jgi:hypothetical protein